MGKKNRHGKKRKHMQDFKDDKQQGLITQKEFKGWKQCSHTGEVPILIGGFEIRLGGSPKINQAAMQASNLLISFNGHLPDKMYFGQVITLMNCALPDRGGVPTNWAEVMGLIIENMKNGFKPLIWCHGSHGRTGVAAASLIALLEPDVEDPIAAIRERHCEHAVESREQAEAIFALKGMPLPAKYEEEFKKWVPTTNFTTYSTKPEANGKSVSGLYYHHSACRCVLCKESIEKKLPVSSFQSTPCECKDKNCLWDGVVRPPEGPFHHCGGCLCGLCTDQRYLLSTYCQCPKECKNKEGGEVDIFEKTPKPAVSSTVGAVVDMGGNHEWYCICKTCIIAESDGSMVCFNTPNCNCMACTLAWKKEELNFVDSINHKYGSIHPDNCACAQCIYDLEQEEAEEAAEAALDAEYEANFAYCMEDAEDGSGDRCPGDTENPCEHMMAAAEYENKMLQETEIHGVDCQCEECWTKQPMYVN